VAGADAALEYALTAPKPERIEEALQRSLPSGIDATLAAYKTYVAEPTHRFLSDPEARVNALGYTLITTRRLPEAIIIFEVNARTHPHSANAYDSLGEAYADARDKQHALAAYQRSLELNPENANAREMMKKLKNAP
jgi:tetratricopeptide (TPR) repeat protein